jgi:hypothetical protein
VDERTKEVIAILFAYFVVLIMFAAGIAIVAAVLYLVFDALIVHRS